MWRAQGLVLLKKDALPLDGSKVKRVAVLGPNAQATTTMQGNYHGNSAIKIVGTFGWAAVPKPVHAACLIQCSRLFHRRSAPFGIVEGQDAGMMTLRKLDPDVQKLLETYRMPTTVFA